MPAVNADGTLPGSPADFQQYGRCLRRVLFVVLVRGFHHELISREALRPVALLAGLAGRSQEFHGRMDGARVSVKGDRKNLANTGKLRADKPARARPDVAFHAIHVSMGRALVRGEFGSHHCMTGLPAELSRIHVGDASIGGGTKNNDVQERRDGDKQNRMPDHGIPQADGRVNFQELASCCETPAAQQDAGGHKQKSQNEDSRKDEEQQDPDIRMGRTRKKKLVKPERHKSRRAACGQDSAGERERILSQKVEQPKPATDGPTNCHILWRSPVSFSCADKRSPNCKALGVIRRAPRKRKNCFDWSRGLRRVTSCRDREWPPPCL